MVLQPTKAFALSRKFIHREFFPQYPDFQNNARKNCYNYYKRWIFKPVDNHRQLEIKLMNKKRHTYSEITFVPKNLEVKTIPTRQMYLNVAYMHNCPDSHNFLKKARKRRVSSSIQFLKNKNEPEEDEQQPKNASSNLRQTMLSLIENDLRHQVSLAQLKDKEPDITKDLDAASQFLSEMAGAVKQSIDCQGVQLGRLISQMEKANLQ